ncbi:MAG: hypothetical protein L0K47_13485, partial [Acidipropionibacterium jensenii]
MSTTDLGTLINEAIGDISRTDSWPIVGDDQHASEYIAARLIAAGWRPPARVVTTMEELDALPDGTVIQDILGATWTLYEGLDDGIDPDDPTNYRWAIGLNGNF